MQKLLTLPDFLLHFTLYEKPIPRFRPGDRGTDEVRQERRDIGAQQANRRHAAAARCRGRARRGGEGPGEGRRLLRRREQIGLHRRPSGRATRPRTGARGHEDDAEPQDIEQEARRDRATRRRLLRPSR